MNKIFFVVPVYKVEKYLGRCTESILAQTYKNIEIVVINDGSTDGGATREACLKYGDSIIYLEKENGVYYFKLNLKIGLVKR